METDHIRKSILLRAPLSRVWSALANSSEFGTWFGMKFDGDFQPGTTVHGVIVPTAVDPEVANAQKPYEGLPFDLAIERMEPERVFSFRWRPYAIDRGRDYSAEPTTLVVFELNEQQDGVLLTVTESGFDALPMERRATAFRANEQGWTMSMKLIEAYLDGTTKRALGA